MKAYLPTTPIDNILYEANLPSLIDRIYGMRARLLPKLLNSTNSILDSEISSIIASAKPKRIQSALASS